MAFQPEAELSCAICHEVFEDPVVLSCGHSFCKECIEQWWGVNQRNSCPICKRRASRRDPTRNLALRSAAEVWKQMKLKHTNKPFEQVTEDFCSVHSEKLKLFCLNDQQSVCVVCRDSKAHRNHSFKPIDEAAQDLRKKLQKSLTPLEEKLYVLEKFKENCYLSLVHIKSQTSQAKEMIKDQFKTLHQFLLEEEEARVRALREEEEQKTQRMKDKMAAVSREIEALSETIRATEEQLRAADVSFLLRYKAPEERVQEQPQLDPGALIDQAKHLGNLGFNIWTNMKRMVQYTPVILDPNTAHPELVLSEDLTSFTVGERQQLPLNPERVKMDVEIVRGSEGFTSGSHSWDVEVGHSTDWELGVVTEAAYYIQDDEEVNDGTGWWSITFSQGEYKTFTADKKKVAPLKVKPNPRRIRLHLECNKQKLTFYDADTNKCIHSFTQIHQQKVFPVFVSGSDEPITILPQKL